jgi:hypothetical protein
MLVTCEPIIVDLLAAASSGDAGAGRRLPGRRGDAAGRVGAVRGVASDPVVSRLVTRLAADAPRALKAIRAARAAARERAWDAAPGSGSGLLTVDIDATIVTACSDKERAAPIWKKTWDFHPLAVFADHGPHCSGEPLAIVLRPGNAGSTTAADHIEAARPARLNCLPGGGAVS